MVRAGLGYSVLPLYSTLRREGLFFSEKIGSQSVTLLLRPPGKEALSEAAQKVYEAVLTALQRQSRAAVYFDKKLGWLPMELEYYSGKNRKKYGYFVAAATEAESSSATDLRYRWCAQTVVFKKARKTPIPGSERERAFEYEIELSADVTNHVGTTFKAHGRQLGRAFLHLFHTMTPSAANLKKTKGDFVFFSTVYNVYYDQGKQGGVWLGRWFGWSREQGKPCSYGSIMSDTPLHPDCVREFAAMNDVLAILEPDNMDDSVRRLYEGKQ